MAEQLFASSCATLSWIDPRTGLPETDVGDPGTGTTRADIISQRDRYYRFSNFLDAWVRVDDGGNIVGHGFSAASGMYRSPSFLHIPSQVIGVVRDVKLILYGVIFRQLVGCRTQSPEVIGSGVGGVVGGAFGGIVGGYVGEKAGGYVAGKVKGFPPIWTELELTMRADGTASSRLIRHSLFPSNCYYTQQAAPTTSYGRVSLYDGMPNYQNWLDHGWGGGNPWGYPAP
jgi:hypothetical protein